jgi:hypothetical protein
MKNVLFLFVVSCLFWSACCNRCDKKDENLGSVSLSSDSKSILKLTGNERLIFKDSIGTEQVFIAVAPKRCSTNLLDVARLCDSPTPCADSYAVMNAEACSLSFGSINNPNSQIRYTIFMYSLLSRDSIVTTKIDTSKVLIEIFQVSSNELGDLNGGFVTKNKALATSGVYPNTKKKTVLDTVIQGRRFTNLVQSIFEGSNANWWYSPEKGIVCFTDYANKQWVLDRIE